MDRIEGRLYKHGVPLHIENHPFLVLAALIERPEDIVSREELQHRIWGDDINVSFEDGLNTAVRKLRYALRDSADSPMFIETVPKRGYRFVAPLSTVNDVRTPEQIDPVEVEPAEEIHLVVEETPETSSQGPAATSRDDFNLEKIAAPIGID
jgi:DNA-binding winged helix-turn-helix (wHTH) protein